MPSDSRHFFTEVMKYAHQTYNDLDISINESTKFTFVKLSFTVTGRSFWWMTSLIPSVLHHKYINFDIAVEPESVLDENDEYQKKLYDDDNLRDFQLYHLKNDQRDLIGFQSFNDKQKSIVFIIGSNPPSEKSIKDQIIIASLQGFDN